MGKKKQKTGKNYIAFIIVGIIVISGYFLISKVSNSSKNTVADQTEAELLIHKDLKTSYPATPREVVKLFSRYSKCLYSGEVNDKEIEQLANQVRLMYDKDLLDNNPMDEYLYDLKLDIAEYASYDRKITSYRVDSSNNAISWTENDMEYTRMIVSYTTKEGSTYYKTFEEFLLRKDENSEWKIVGFRETGTDEIK